MFNASYPASFLHEGHGKGFHVRFPDVPEALTSGDDLEDTLLQAGDCLAEAIAGRIARGNEIPPRPRLNEGSISLGFRSTLRRSWRYTLLFVNAAYQTPSLPSA